MGAYFSQYTLTQKLDDNELSIKLLADANILDLNPKCNDCNTTLVMIPNRRYIDDFALKCATCKKVKSFQNFCIGSCTRENPVVRFDMESGKRLFRIAEMTKVLNFMKFTQTLVK